jgi:hypothetical protein
MTMKPCSPMNWITRRVVVLVRAGCAEAMCSGFRDDRDYATFR